MAINDTALFTAARGYIYVGDGDAVPPTPADVVAFDPATFGTVPASDGWVNLGHTSREDLPEFGFDGGDTETRGTWQNSALKEVITDVTVDYVTMNLHQFDDTNLELYYSQANHLSAAVGEFWVTDAPTATLEKKLLIVIVDGAAKIAFYARKASLRRDDAIGMEVDNFAVMPVRATFLKDSTHELYRWISSDMGINPT